jgi:hypothetical protein
MNLPVALDFMPESVHRAVRVARSRRRCALLGGLLLALCAGTSLHSWNAARRADGEREVSAQRVAHQVGVDEVIDRMTVEREDLERALNITDGFMPSVTPSAVVATLTHLMPARTVLHGVRIAMEDNPRQLAVTVRGHAAGIAEVKQLQDSLAAQPAFQRITVSESRGMEIRDRRVQAFAISFQVPLQVRVRAARSPVRQEVVQ